MSNVFQIFKGFQSFLIQIQICRRYATLNLEYKYASGTARSTSALRTAQTSKCRYEILDSVQPSV